MSNPDDVARLREIKRLLERIQRLPRLASLQMNGPTNGLGGRAPCRSRNGLRQQPSRSASPDRRGGLGAGAGARAGRPAAARPAARSDPAVIRPDSPGQRAQRLLGERAQRRDCAGVGGRCAQAPRRLGVSPLGLHRGDGRQHRRRRRSGRRHHAGRGAPRRGACGGGEGGRYLRPAAERCARRPRPLELLPVGSPSEPLRLEALKPARLPFEVRPEEAVQDSYILVLTGLPANATLSGASTDGGGGVAPAAGRAAAAGDRRA